MIVEKILFLKYIIIIVFGVAREKRETFVDTSWKNINQQTSNKTYALFLQTFLNAFIEPKT